MSSSTMINKHLIAKTEPIANNDNVIVWKNYRITILGEQLFRLENSNDKVFRDGATQIVWFRNAPKQDFSCFEDGDCLYIKTAKCTLKVATDRAECKIAFNDDKWLSIDNQENLLGTFRTLDCCDGDIMKRAQSGSNSKRKTPKKVKLENGVCSRTGVALFNDENSLTLASDGTITAEKGNGSDEYIFAFKDDYRSAIKALYQITGKTPVVPRFALGNWWSRYYAYTQEEYLQTLTKFIEADVPLSVATIDMDWHWSKTVADKFKLEEQGKTSKFYTNKEIFKSLGWTGYSWNTDLFPDYKALLKEIDSMNLKTTLNLHPADGVRFWEDQYIEMAKRVGIDPETQQAVPFDITDENFLNAYFDLLHKPYEQDGVAFWWIDWQQGKNSKLEGLDPLWALNHYHYLDNQNNHSKGLILSRYSGIGSHRYPLGFSGDTHITWKTLKYLVYFTLTATNVGYTWWSHDIGGHYDGEKDDEMYVRHLQFGVFSPINRLHCSNNPLLNKEPWGYKNGTGEIAKNMLRFRHQLIPYLYTATYLNNEQGKSLIEPLYYQWKQQEAYACDTEYLFGEQLLVMPVVTKMEKDGFARVNAWIPQGEWTDIFTGDKYIVGAGGVKKQLLRTLDSIPVLIRAGGILPLSRDKGNGTGNPINMDLWTYTGNGEYVLYEDNEQSICKTKITPCLKDGVDNSTQIIKLESEGDNDVIPKNRKIRVVLKDVDSWSSVKLFVDGVEVVANNPRLTYPATKFCYDGTKSVEVHITFPKKTKLQSLKERATTILSQANHTNNNEKLAFYNVIQSAQSVNELVRVVNDYKSTIKNGAINNATKQRLLETIIN